MSENIENSPSKKRINKIIEKEIPSKIIDAGKHKGKVKWGEDPLKWQKKIRDEWR